MGPRAKPALVVWRRGVGGRGRYFLTEAYKGHVNWRFSSTTCQYDKQLNIDVLTTYSKWKCRKSKKLRFVEIDASTCHDEENIIIDVLTTSWSRQNVNILGKMPVRFDSMHTNSWNDENIKKKIFFRCISSSKYPKHENYRLALFQICNNNKNLI